MSYRLTWRFKNQAPGLPASLEAYQKVLARITHGFLYTLLFVMPLSGWAAQSVLGESPQAELWFFGWDIVPPIMPQLPLDNTFGYAFFARIHRYALYTGGVILSLHILAALWHHFARKDNILLRMWPAGAVEPGREPEGG